MSARLNDEVKAVVDKEDDAGKEERDCETKIYKREENRRVQTCGYASKKEENKGYGMGDKSEFKLRIESCFRK